MELSIIKDSFEEVAEKQKLSCSLYQELIDQVCHEFERSLITIQSDNDSVIPLYPRSILTDLKAKLAVTVSNNSSEGMQQELNVNISQLQKLLEISFNRDISKACRNVDFDPLIVNQIIVNHFCREGQFDILNCLLKEARAPELVSMRLQFEEIHQILEDVRSKNLETSLNWVAANREILKESGSDLELKLHKLQFLDILQNRPPADALKYAKTYLAPLAAAHMNEVQKLMCCLVWSGKLDKSPYTDLVSPIHWEKLPEEILQAFYNFSGQSCQNPLKVALAAGVEGLPTLLKLESVMAVKKEEWQDMKQLPVPLELGKEFQFHSIFVCPVSRDQASEKNPPMLLPCGHVLCKLSIFRLWKSNEISIKCPYCPLIASFAHCKQLYF